MRRHSRDERSARRRNRRRSDSDTSDSSGDQSPRRHRVSDASDDELDASRRRTVVSNTSGDGEALSFEHLEAIRGVTLLKRNEYPLPQLPREKLFKPDDANAECGCPFPANGKRDDEDTDDDGDDPEKSRCDDVSCLNFATYIECSPEQCDAGKYCKNQRLQHPELFPKLEAFKVRCAYEWCSDGELTGDLCVCRRPTKATACARAARSPRTDSLASTWARSLTKRNCSGGSRASHGCVLFVLDPLVIKANGRMHIASTN
jgi:hypothetical protein